MNKSEIENWARAGRDSAISELGFPKDWWPMTQAKFESEATAWALSFFIHAAIDRCSGFKLTAAVNASDQKPHNKKMLAKLWTSAERVHQEEQVLVDFSVHNWDAASPVQITGESETNASQSTDDTLGPKTYSWDFYKLLVVPSTTRLFFARVGGDGGVGAVERCKRLARTLIELVDWYGPALLRPHDELGAVISPSAKTERNETIILWLDRGRLRQEKMTAGLLG